MHLHTYSCLIGEPSTTCEQGTTNIQTVPLNKYQSVVTEKTEIYKPENLEKEVLSKESHNSAIVHVFDVT